MSDRGIYRDESRIRHMCNALEKVVEKSCGVHRDDLVEGEDNTELIIHSLVKALCDSLPIPATPDNIDDFR